MGGLGRGDVAPDGFYLCLEEIHVVVTIVSSGGGGGGVHRLWHPVYCREQEPGVGLTRANEGRVV